MTSNFSQSEPPLRVVVSRDAEESEHLVDVVISSADGLVGGHGRTDSDVIPRSAIKPIQVIPLILSGAAEAYAVTDAEVALGAASHSGEIVHLEAVEAWLSRIGLDVADLECGVARPLSTSSADRVLRNGQEFEPIHNCCSGKHAGFLTIAQHLGVDPAGYTDRNHPVQQLVIDAVETFTGVPLGDNTNGVDGCGIPTFAIPLVSLARSMARLADPASLDDRIALAAKRVTEALAANPMMLSGTGRREVELAWAGKEPLVAKTGAEGVFMVALPERGIGIALKARDGATRAADLAIAAVLERLGAIDSGLAVQNVTNAAGTVVGAMQVHES